MPKRAAETSREVGPCKRRRQREGDSVSELSDELLLRILSYLPISTLTSCERLSQRLSVLAGDSQLWKAAYFDYWIRPRLLRSPRRKRVPSVLRDGPNRLSIRSTQIENDRYFDEKSRVHWKKKFKTRHNWANGRCNLSEIVVSDPPVAPRILVQLHAGVIYTADVVDGLRVWSKKSDMGLISVQQLRFGGAPGRPTACPACLAVGSIAPDYQRVAIGFEDGAFNIYDLSTHTYALSKVYSHRPSFDGAVTGATYLHPYLLTMTANQTLSLYNLSSKGGESQALDGEPGLCPKLLYTLKSHTAWSPASLSMRQLKKRLVISVVYAFPTYTSGWAVGLQELQISLSGELLRSRVATVTESGPSWLKNNTSSTLPPLRHRPGLFGTHGYSLVYSKPTSLSYSHPFILVSHADNTLMLFAIVSSDRELLISSGTRLWGHTSAISGAHVGARGRAVSVSSKGGELRLWELEGHLAPSGPRGSATSKASVQVQPGSATEADMERPLASFNTAMIYQKAATESSNDPADAGYSRGLVGFDEENVIVLKGKNNGPNAFAIYDFT